MLVVAVVPAAVAAPAAAATSATATWSAAASRPAQPVPEEQICTDAERSRFRDCKTNVYDWNIREAGTAAPLGTLQARLTIRETLSPDTKYWSAIYSVYVMGAAGAAADGATTMSVVAECAGACTVTSGPSGAKPVGVNSTEFGEVKFEASGSGRPTSRQVINLYFFNPAAVGSGTTSGDFHTELGPVRCDDAVIGEGNGGSKPGCVMVDHVPTYVIDGKSCAQPQCPAHRAFIERAQANPKTQGWGKPGSATPMTRQVLTEREQDAKRRKVCPKGAASNPSQADLPIPQRDSCDEYPYSSSYQGVPEFAVVEIIPGWDNSAAGRQLGRFYAENHILDGDGYYVAP
jgi:hypothetical protein